MIKIKKKQTKRKSKNKPRKKALKQIARKLGPKKGVELSLTTIVILIVLLLTMVVIIYSFTNLFGHERNVTEKYIFDLDADCDNDGIKNIIDKCPCTPGEECSDEQKTDKTCCPKE